MTIDNHIGRSDRSRLWVGRALSLMPALFLLIDGAMKLVKPVPVVEVTVGLGYPESVIVGLGVVLVASTVLYLMPATSVLGCILLTGYLGGAVATHVRVGAEAFPIAFPIILGAMLWSGLVLRDDRLRSLVPWRRRPATPSHDADGLVRSSVLPATVRRHIVTSGTRQL